jgi:GxxExxY protein
MVQDSLNIEIKATEGLARLHEAQLLNYLKLSKFRVGFLMNFNVVVFTHGLRPLMN